VDRDVITRAQRRRQAQEALEFERSRATSLEEQVEEIVAEVEGPRIDEEAFARMAPEDAAAARAVLQPDDAPPPEDDWLGLDGGPPADQPGDAEESEEDDTEEELARLQQEIAASRRRQEVLERYLEALDGGQ
jgi:hypothetical protein